MKVGEENWNENGFRGCVRCERVDRYLSLDERGNAEVCLTPQNHRMYVSMYTVTAFA